MKKLIVLTIAIFLVACATEPPIRSPLPPLPEKFELKPQTVRIIVESATDSKVDVKQGDGVQRSMEVKNSEGQLSDQTFISNGIAYMKVFSGISAYEVTRLWNDFCVLESGSIRDIKLFISSPGGDAFSGISLADGIEHAQKKGFRVVAHASGIIASAAVPVFAVCSERLAAPGTIFMVHEAALWKWPGRETASDIRSQNELMDLLRSKYMEKLVKNSNLNREEWDRLEGKTTWFNAEKALEWGLVDRIE